MYSSSIVVLINPVDTGTHVEIFANGVKRGTTGWRLVSFTVYIALLVSTSLRLPARARSLAGRETAAESGNGSFAEEVAALPSALDRVSARSYSSTSKQDRPRVKLFGAHF